MPKHMRIVLLLLVAPAAFAADIYDKNLDSGYRLMYNLEFDAAHKTFAEWKQSHPGDPMGPVSNAAAYLFSELERLRILDSELFVDDDRFLSRQKLTADSSVKYAFTQEIAQARQDANRALARAPHDQNSEFAEILADGLESDYFALIEKKYVASLASVKAGRTLAQQLLSAHPDCYDAYLAIGVENYLLSLKPAPVRWVLEWTGSQVSKTEGIAKLRLTAEHGHLLQPFARLLLAVAALRDHDRATAQQILDGLVHEFPNNRLYSAELARMRNKN